MGHTAASANSANLATEIFCATFVKSRSTVMQSLAVHVIPTSYGGITLSAPSSVNADRIAFARTRPQRQVVTGQTINALLTSAKYLCAKKKALSLTWKTQRESASFASCTNQLPKKSPSQSL